MSVVVRKSVPSSLAQSPEAAYQFRQAVILLLDAVKNAQNRNDFAQNIILHLLKEWWQNRYAGKYPLREPFAAVRVSYMPSTNNRIVLELACVLKGLDLLEAGYLVGNLYTTLIDTEVRTRNGVFFTPPNLSSRLMDMAEESGVDWQTACVLDHSCGGGAFLAPVALRMISALRVDDPEAILAHVQTHIRGIEIDPFSAWISQVFLDAVVGKFCLLTGKRLPVLITVADTLYVDGLREQFDLVIGNPPYGKVKLPESVRQRFAESLYGHANLYGIFTHLAFDFARQNGVVALLKPTGFLGGEYFKNLRSFILSRSRPLGIDFVHARKGVFDSVLQETLLVTYKINADVAAKVKINKLQTPSIKHHVVSKLGTYSVPVAGTAPWLLPRIAEQKELLKLASRYTSNLEHWGYKVKTGPLVWNRKKDQLSRTSGSGVVPLIWAESVLPGVGFKWKAELRDHLPFFRLLDGDDWLRTTTSCVLVQRTTAKEQQKRLIAGLLPDGFIKKHKAVVIENHLNLIIPINGSPRVPIDVLHRFLNSDFADGLFRCISGSVAVSAYELESLPLPDPGDLKSICREIEE